MTVIEAIASVVRSGGCVVMGIGVAPEQYRALLAGATSQDYMVIAAKETNDANLIAERIGGELVAPRPLTALGLEMHVCLIKKREGE